MYKYSLKTFNQYLYIMLAGYIIGECNQGPPAASREAERNGVSEAADRLSRPHQPLAEPVTNRELDVLELLA